MEACQWKLYALLTKYPTASPLLLEMRRAIVLEQFSLPVISTTLDWVFGLLVDNNVVTRSYRQSKADELHSRSGSEAGI